MSFRLVIALVALCGAGLAVAADPPAAPSPAAAPTSAGQTTGTPTSAPTTQPEGSQKPQQTEVATSVNTSNENAAAKPGDASAGQGKSATCAACHGMDGNPASSQYPKLAGQHEEYIARQLELFKAKHRDNPVMYGFAAPLQPQDMHDLGAYFASKASLPGVADAKLVARGELLYRGGDKDHGVPACLACHGPDGRGNPGAGYPQLGGQYADYVTAKLKDFAAGKGFNADDRGQIMVTVAKGLSDQDIAALASYIEGLHTAGAASTAAK
jgi:cytochrome c553